YFPASGSGQRRAATRETPHFLRRDAPRLGALLRRASAQRRPRPGRRRRRVRRGARMMRASLLLFTLLLLPAFADALTLSIHAGNNQVADPGNALPVDPAVRVTDSNGLPVAGETVEFSIAAGGGLLSGATQT